MVAIYKKASGGDGKLGEVATTHPLLPGQTETLPLTAPSGTATMNDHFVAKIVVDAMHPNFRECRADNDESAVVSAICVQ